MSFNVNQIGKTIGQIAEAAWETAVEHHPSDYPLEIKGVTLLVREQAYGIGHEIELEVIESPDDKLNGYKTGIQHGPHAKKAREACFKVLEYQVTHTYQ